MIGIEMISLQKLDTIGLMAILIGVCKEILDQLARTWGQ